MSAVQRTGVPRILRWPGAVVEAGSERLGRHHVGTRARLTWHTMFYSGRHRM
jgi:hypothetical protein